MDPRGKAGGPMRIGTPVLLGVPLGAVLGNAIVAPFPEPGGNPALTSESCNLGESVWD